MRQEDGEMLHVRVGGQVPPMARGLGRRREFGVKGLERARLARAEKARETAYQKDYPTGQSEDNEVSTE